jgi:hypothetical protein
MAIVFMQPIRERVTPEFCTFSAHDGGGIGIHAYRIISDAIKLQLQKASASHLLPRRGPQARD